MTRKQKYPKAVTIRMTNEMYATLRRLATDDRKVAGVIRQLIRNQLDERAELAGNRRYFTRRFRERIDELEENLEMRFTLLTMLLTMFEELVIHTLEVSEGRGGPLTYPALFRDGVYQAAEYWAEVEMAVDNLRALMHGTGEEDDIISALLPEDEEDEPDER